MFLLNAFSVLSLLHPIFLSTATPVLTQCILRSFSAASNSSSLLHPNFLIKCILLFMVPTTSYCSLAPQFLSSASLTVFYNHLYHTVLILGIILLYHRLISFLPSVSYCSYPVHPIVLTNFIPLLFHHCISLFLSSACILLLLSTSYCSYPLHPIVRIHILLFLSTASYCSYPYSSVLTHFNQLFISLILLFLPTSTYCSYPYPIVRIHFNLLFLSISYCSYPLQPIVRIHILLFLSTSTYCSYPYPIVLIHFNLLFLSISYCSYPLQLLYFLNSI